MSIGESVNISPIINFHPLSNDSGFALRGASLLYSIFSFMRLIPLFSFVDQGFSFEDCHSLLLVQQLFVLLFLSYFLLV